VKPLENIGKTSLFLPPPPVIGTPPESGATSDWSSHVLFSWKIEFIPIQSLVAREMLTPEVVAWEQQRNQAQVTIDWHFTTVDARIKLKRLYPVLKEQKEQKAAYQSTSISLC
jgi:hypothetical protein